MAKRSGIGYTIDFSVSGYAIFQSLAAFVAEDSARTLLGENTVGGGLGIRVAKELIRVDSLVTMRHSFWRPVIASSYY